MPMSAAPRHVETKRLKLDVLSAKVGVSGHREPDPTRISELRSLFEGGAFGQSDGSRVSVLQALDSDGLNIIDDGLQTVLALQQLVKATSVDDLPPSIREICSEGLLVDVVQYVDDQDRSSRIKYQAMRHDADSNRMRFTSLLQISVVVGYFMAESKQNVQECKKAMEAYYGKARARTIGRWADAATCVPESIIRYASTIEGFNNYFVYDNQFFLQKGKAQLSEQGLRCSLQLLDEALQSGNAVSPTDFSEKYCRPLKVARALFASVCRVSNTATAAGTVHSFEAELWLQKVRKTYGQRAECAMFERVSNLLFSGRGRALRLATKRCISTVHAMMGSPCAETKDKHLLEQQDAVGGTFRAEPRHPGLQKSHARAFLRKACGAARPCFQQQPCDCPLSVRVCSS